MSETIEVYNVADKTAHLHVSFLGGSMAICSTQHKELGDNGVGKCSVPMWCNGVPEGFCDNAAYGEPLPYETFRDRGGRIRRFDGGYCGYVPGLACSAHGGPKTNKQIQHDA